MGKTVTFQCSCGQIKGEVKSVPDKGNHLLCYCESCRAGARYCGARISADEPVDLYLTPAHNVRIIEGQANLNPFAFSPGGVIRWKAVCCGIQVFSSQPKPKIAFMSLSARLITDSQAVGPVSTRSFVPKANGKTAHEGKVALAKLILGVLAARLTGKWRQNPLLDPETLRPIAEVTLVSKEEKRALLAQGCRRFSGLLERGQMAGMLQHHQFRVGNELGHKRMTFNRAKLIMRPA